MRFLKFCFMGLVLGMLAFNWCLLSLLLDAALSSNVCRSEKTHIDVPSHIGEDS